MKIRVTREIACPQAHLWQYFEDLERVKDWVPGLVEVVVTSPPPHGEGSTFVMRVEEWGRVVEYQGRNLEWSPMERIR